MDKSVLELSRRLPVLSLEKMALIRTTTLVCNNPELLSLITRVRSFRPGQHYASLGNDWNNIQTKARGLISRLELSVALQDKIMEMVWPVCYKIMLWKFTYAPFLASKFLRHFYWTDHGKIDHIRTMESLIKDTRISLRNRFILACGMSLIAEMSEMWTKMSDVDKKYFNRPKKQIICPLLLFWTHFLEESDKVVDDYMRKALICSIENGLFEGIKGLFNICSLRKRKDLALFCLEEFHEKKIGRFYLEEDDIDIGFFIFSEIPEENQTTIFNTKSDFIFGLLLHSSDDRYFKNLLEERLHSVPEFELVAPLYIIFHTYHLEVNQDYDYGSLFIEVWRKLPISVKVNMRTIGLGEAILASLIRDNFRCLLDNTIPLKNIPELVSISKGKMVFRDSSMFSSPIRFHQGKWKFLHFIVSENVATIAYLVKMKELFFHELGESIYDENIDWTRVLKFVLRIEKISHQLYNLRPMW